MTFQRRHLIAAVALSALASGAFAQGNYPSRPITFGSMP